MRYRLLRIAGTFAAAITLSDLAAACHRRADHLIVSGRAFRVRARRRRPRSYEDNAVRWLGGQIVVGFILSVLYLIAFTLGWVSHL